MNANRRNRRKLTRKQLLARVLKRAERPRNYSGDLPWNIFTSRKGTEPSQFSPEDQKLFRKQEQIIEKAKRQGDAKSFELGRALALIHSKKFYKDAFKKGGFDAYCKKRWGIAKSHAHRLIDAVHIMDILSPIGDTLPCLPTHESQVRSLAKLPADVVRSIWRAVTEEANNGRITHRRVSQAVTRWRRGQSDLAGEPALDPTRPIKITLEDARWWQRQVGYVITFVDQEQKEDALEALSKLQTEIGKFTLSNYRRKHGLWRCFAA